MGGPIPPGAASPAAAQTSAKTGVQAKAHDGPHRHRRRFYPEGGDLHPHPFCGSVPTKGVPPFGVFLGIQGRVSRAGGGIGGTTSVPPTPLSFSRERGVAGAPAGRGTGAVRVFVNGVCSGGKRLRSSRPRARLPQGARRKAGSARSAGFRSSSAGRDLPEGQRSTSSSTPAVVERSSLASIDRPARGSAVGAQVSQSSTPRNFATTR